jgi:hypothetical protein
MIKAICEYCGKEYIKRHKKSRCCSQECNQALYRKEHKTTYTKVCPICGTEFETTNSVVKYCGEICACKARSIKSLKYAKRVSQEPRACVECGGEFIPKSTLSRFCSQDCRKIYTTKNYKKNFQPKICTHCGKEFIPNSTGAKYCSEECRNKGKKKAEEKKASERKSPNTKKIKKSDYPDVPSSKRWEKMNLAERSKECARYHLTYGQAQTMAYGGKLPEDFGEDVRNGK